MDFLGPFHAQIVHTPIALIIFSLAFDVVGRALDSDWWRKASMVLLVVGTLGAVAAVLSGEAASDRVEDRQGVPERVVDGHGDMGKLTMWIAGGAVVARLVEPAAGAARTAVGIVALLLQLAASITVGITGHRGGNLVFQQGAGVEIDGKLITHPGAKPEAGEGAKVEHAGTRAGGGDHEAREAGGKDGD